jgi:uncharacterized protein (DUF2062 family)
MLVDPTPPTTSRRTVWQRRVRDPLVAQLTQGITPEKLALTLAVGGACALFPILGTTTILCLVVAIVLRLNQPIIQLLNQAFWPLHVPAIFGCVRLGETLYGVPHVSFNLRRMHTLFWHEPARFFHDYGTPALYAITAWAMLAPVFVVIVYYAMLPLMRGVARIKSEAVKPAGDA